jgi:hypothetical protein
MTNTSARCLAAAAFVAAAGLLAACAPSQAQTSLRDGPASRVPEAGKGPPTGLVPAAPGLAVRLVLSRTSVTAGTPIAGTLVVTNPGRRPVNLNHGCRPQYAVVLTRPGIPPTAGFPALCGSRPFIIKPGQNRLPVTVFTTYSGCTQAAGQATSTVPACRHGRQLVPPLPPGRYRAVLVGDGLPLPAPAPVAVTLSSPGGKPM